MTEDIKVAHGTTAWFDMVGTVLMDAARQARLAPGLNVSLVESYTDGSELSLGVVQGLRFQIIDGAPSFRPGARHGERGDITVDVTTAASHRLNTLYGADPLFQTGLAQFAANGELTIHGDMAQLGSWFGAVHDRIVDRTG